MFALILILTTAIIAPVASRTVHSVLVFSRHGDRTSKFYKDYQMTNLGAAQCFDSGTYYRERYIADGASDQIAGISSQRADHAQLWVSAPDQPVLFQTALNFAQGLYPPLGDLDENLATEELANGTSIQGPLNGYQYIHIQGEAENAPDTIWLKGDEECPAWTYSSEEYKKSEEYQQTMTSSEDFYARLVPLLGDIMGPENVSFAQAYNVFDLLNTAFVQNTSLSELISPVALDQARYLANEWEWNMNFNASNMDRAISGMSLAGGILRQVQSVVSERAATKFSLMTGSYDTFLAFFGLVGLPAVSADFKGLPNYASTMAFELFSETDNAEFPSNPEEDLRVRFLFRNGTNSGEELTAYSLFGSSKETMPYGAFVASLRERAITSVGEWCERCAAGADFCLADTSDAAAGAVPSTDEVSDAAAELIVLGLGVGLNIAFFAIVILALDRIVLVKRLKQTMKPEADEKLKSDSDSGSDSV